MPDLSQYLQRALVDHIFNQASFSSLTNVYVALTTATIIESNTGSTITEPASNYVRIITSTADWTRGGDIISNDLEIAFVEATGTWGTITDIALCDAISAGNILCFRALGVTRDILSGDTARFLAGDLDFSLD